MDLAILVREPIHAPLTACWAPPERRNARDARADIWGGEHREDDFIAALDAEDVAIAPFGQVGGGGPDVDGIAVVRLLPIGDLVVVQEIPNDHG